MYFRFFVPPKSLFFLFLFIALSQVALGQFAFRGELLERAQWRNGARTLPTADQSPAAFLTQRSRLAVDYQGTDFGTYISFQDVRTWGSQDQENVGATLNVYKAYGDLYLGDRLTVRAGRQGLTYDDGYLFTDPNWREAGRSHDAIKVMYEDSTLSVHVGGAYNANGLSAFATPYIVDTYQNMQWAWARKTLGERSHVSLIGVRRQYDRTLFGGTLRPVAYTAGGEVASGVGPLKAKLVGYYQWGEHADGQAQNAWFAAARFQYQHHNWQFALLGHLLSGTATQEVAATGNLRRRSFDILYGFRHRYFGTMDYFYSTTYDPYFGLVNLMGRSQWQATEALSLRADLHAFWTQADISDAAGTVLNPYLATELDLSFQYNWKPQVKFAGGYSQLWATNTLAQGLGSGDPDETANWLWIQMYLTPTFFSSDK